MNKEYMKSKADVFTDIGICNYIPRHPLGYKDTINEDMKSMINSPSIKTLSFMDVLNIIEHMNPWWIDENGTICGASGVTEDSINAFHTALMNNESIVIAEPVDDEFIGRPNLYMYDSAKYDLRRFELTADRFNILGAFVK